MGIRFQGTQSLIACFLVAANAQLFAQNHFSADLQRTLRERVEREITEPCKAKVRTKSADLERKLRECTICIAGDVEKNVASLHELSDMELQKCDASGTRKAAEMERAFVKKLSDPAMRYEPIDALVVNEADRRGAAEYATVINQWDVERSVRYAAASKGPTYCNIFAEDVARAMGVGIPQMRANDAVAWFAAHGSERGWHRVDAETAQKLADKGLPTLGMWPNPHGHGHMLVIRPGTPSDPRGDAIAQAGQSGFIANARHLNQQVRDIQLVQYWYHE